jgi:predicted metalloprotease with PDZ domain
LRFEATLRVPAAWRYGTALPIRSESGNEIQFQPSSLTTLIDSPVSAGAFYRTIDLGSDRGAKHFLHLAADSARALEITPEQVTSYKNLVAETGALFGSRHYRDYHFLLTLSEHVAHFGLEHHESSDNRAPERVLIDEGPRKAWADLLTHEFVHSWNGKFRRPYGLATGGFDKPMKGDLLWVYEGLTQYLGEILVPRIGLYTPEEFRETLAANAASLETESGRRWRPLEDTAVAAQILYGARGDYSDYRRSVDYYFESELIWLEADVLIRQLSRGHKSLDDFCRAFHGGPGGQPELKPYTLEDVIAALNAVQAYDWAGFLNTRIYTTQPHAPLGGLENSGWKLVYNSTRSAIWNDFEDDSKTTNLMYSLGIGVKSDGTVSDVVVGGPADRAGVAPLVKIVAVDGRQFSTGLLREAIEAAASKPEPLELLVRSGEFYKTYKVDYHGGERYPHLERDPSKPDLLSQIVAPLVKPR